MPGNNHILKCNKTAICKDSYLEIVLNVGCQSQVAILPPGTDLPAAYARGSDEEQAFVQNLAMFLTSYFRVGPVLRRSRPRLQRQPRLHASSLPQPSLRPWLLSMNQHPSIGIML